jgi:hypothetical protein
MFKMKKNLFALVWVQLCLLTSFYNVHAQVEGKKYTLFGDVSGRVASGQFGGGPSVWGHRGFGTSRRFSIGVGLRHSTHIGTKQEFTTAPPEFSTDEKLVDTLTLANSSVTSLNLALDFRYKVFKKLSIGFNIDAIGFSFGPDQTGNLVASPVAFSAKAKPTSLNVLLIGDNDIGTLNSEFYLVYHATEKLGLKLGLSYLFTEYSTDRKYVSGIDNDRYRNKSMGGALGVQYIF